MACSSFKLRSDGLVGAYPGGEWSYLGYSLTESGSPGSGGTTPGSLTGDNPELSFNEYIPGFYSFKYSKTPVGDCDLSEAILKLQIVSPLSAGVGSTISFCEASAFIVDLNDLLSGNDLGGTWSISTNGDSPAAGTFSGHEFNTDGNGIGTYIFSYSISPVVATGYTLIDCHGCISYAEVTVVISPPCDPGEDGTITVTDSTGTIDLFDVLNGTPDPGGIWVQLTGSPVTINDGHVNLNGVAGCVFTFEYTCNAPPRCGGSAIVTVYKNSAFNVTSEQVGNTLVATSVGCDGGTLTYQWSRWNGSAWVNIAGAISAVYLSAYPNTLHRVQAWCTGCEDSATVFYEYACNNANLLSMQLLRVGNCLQLTATGAPSSPVSSDNIYWRQQGQSNWNLYPPLCDCNFRAFLEVAPSCSTNANNIQIGFSAASKCAGHTIDRVYVRYGNGTQATYTGTFTSFSEVISASDYIDLYNRDVMIRVRVNIGSGRYLIQDVKFTYSGSYSAPTCNQINISKINHPEFVYTIECKRVVTFADGCPSVTILDVYNPDNCPAVFVTLAKTNNGGIPSVTATVYNCLCQNAVVAYTWYKDGALLNGETSNTVSRTTYGEGLYEVLITCCGCSAVDELVTEGCNMVVTVASNAGQYTATSQGCTGSKTFTWQRWTGTAWSDVRTYTTTNNTDTYTPTTSGDYKVSVCCTTPTCCRSVNFSVEINCSIAITLASDGVQIIASVTGCTGSKTFTWQRWTGTAWSDVRTYTTTNNTDTYTPTTSGMYRCIVACAADNCVAIAQIPFEVSCSVEIVVTGTELYTASVTGCAGNKTFLWEMLSNAGIWVSKKTTTTSSNTDTYNPTETGYFRATAICAADGCVSTDYFNNVEPADCLAVVSIVPTGTIFNAVVSGCTGSISYKWYRRITPGSGSWGSVISTASSVNVASFGEGEYKVIIQCDSCEAEDTEIYTVACSYTVTPHCGNSPLTYTINGCLTAIFYQVQFSLTGAGWTTIIPTTSTNGGTSVTITVPITNGNGYYRLITWCGTYGTCPQATDCHVTTQCGATGVLTAGDCASEDVDFLFFIDISGSITTEEFTLYKASIEATIDAIDAASNINARYAVVQFSYGYELPVNPNIYISVPFTSNPVTAKTFTRQTGSSAFFNEALETLRDKFPSDLSWRTGATKHLVLFTDAPSYSSSSTLLKFGDYDNPATPYFEQINAWKVADGILVSVIKYPTGNAPWDAPAISSAAAIASVGGRYTGSIDGNAADPQGSGVLPRRLETTNFGDPVSDIIALIAPTCRLLTLVVSGCSGALLSWQLSVDGGTTWSIVQNGGYTYTADIAGKYRVKIVCGDCPAAYSNTITIN